ncbi:MAG TPA: mevalonate kinase [Methanomassiliicoccales archaeon]|nr:mevalonate kinase [Methanomassiliicoccales archaeon]
MVTASAPGKVILLGEHAVVFGYPAISMAVDLRLRLQVTPGAHFTLNDHHLSAKSHAYICQALTDQWVGGPLAIRTDSDFPSGSGLGSSAAVSVSMLAALHELNHEQFNEANIAQGAFNIESVVQGRASPIDTSTSAHGHGIMIDRKPGEGLLWHIKRDTREWYIHHCEVPEMTLVVGFTGINAPTGPQVAKVKRYFDKNTFAREVVAEIGSLTSDGLKCLRQNDRVGLGRLMTRDHKMLAILGVSCKALDKLVQASMPYSYGAKLTGSGGGGSMIALTDRPLEVAEVIASKGGTPFIVRTGVPGVRIEK